MSVLSATPWRFLAASLFLGFAFAATAQSDATSLKDRMSEEEFRAAGLHKLSSDELAALEHWLDGRSITPERAESAATETTGTDSLADAAERERARERERERERERARNRERRGFDTPAPERTAIETRIVGTFDGWRGRGTTFEFENGMVWRQDESGHYPMQEIENPEATISPGWFGSWYMTVGGYNRKVRVERIR